MCWTSQLDVQMIYMLSRTGDSRHDILYIQAVVVERLVHLSRYWSCRSAFTSLYKRGQSLTSNDMTFNDTTPKHTLVACSVQTATGCHGGGADTTKHRMLVT